MSYVAKNEEPHNTRGRRESAKRGGRPQELGRDNMKPEQVHQSHRDKNKPEKKEYKVVEPKTYKVIE